MALKPREQIDLLFYQLQETARRVANLQLECKIQIDVESFANSLWPDIMEVVYSWAKGSKFYQIMEMTQVFEGSMISAIWRLEEALQQLILAPKSIGETKLEANLRRQSARSRGIDVACTSKLVRNSPSTEICTDFLPCTQSETHWNPLFLFCQKRV